MFQKMSREKKEQGEQTFSHHGYDVPLHEHTKRCQENAEKEPFEEVKRRKGREKEVIWEEGKLQR